MPLKIKQLKGQETVGIVAGANHCMAICHNNPAVTEAAAMKVRTLLPCASVLSAADVPLPETQTRLPRLSHA